MIETTLNRAWRREKARKLKLEHPSAPLPRRIAHLTPALLFGLGLGTFFRANEALALMFSAGLILGLIAIHIIERDEG